MTGDGEESDSGSSGDRVRVRIDPDLHQMVMEIMVARKKRRLTDVLNEIIRPAIQAAHRDAVSARPKKPRRPKKG